MTAAPRPREFALWFPPKGLRRHEAAAYIGVSPSSFDQMVHRGFMPRPKRFGRIAVWDRCALDDAFHCLPENESDKPISRNPWDAVSNV